MGGKKAEKVGEAEEAEEAGWQHEEANKERRVKGIKRRRGGGSVCVCVSSRSYISLSVLH